VVHIRCTSQGTGDRGQGTGDRTKEEFKVPAPPRHGESTTRRVFDAAGRLWFQVKAG
jgi:hypothetical protein